MMIIMDVSLRLYTMETNHISLFKTLSAISNNYIIIIGIV